MLFETHHSRTHSGVKKIDNVHLNNRITPKSRCNQRMSMLLPWRIFRMEGFVVTSFKRMR